MLCNSSVYDDSVTKKDQVHNTDIAVSINIRDNINWACCIDSIIDTRIPQIIGTQ